jgi:hypothetical protein
MWARDSSVAAQAVPVVPLSTLIYSFITLKKNIKFPRTGYRDSEADPRRHAHEIILIVGIGPPGVDCFTLGYGGGSINSV